jgi:hypothetical protein
VKLEVSEEIERPVPAVFKFYAEDHVRNHPRWDPDMELEQISPDPIGVGVVIRRRNTHFDTPVEGTMEVVEFEPNRAFGVVINDGPMETHGRVTFEAAGQDRTIITISADFLGMDESMKDHVASLMQRSVRTIKALIEAET